MNSRRQAFSQEKREVTKSPYKPRALQRPFDFEERAILAQSNSAPRRRYRWIALLTAAPLLGVVAAFGIAPSTTTETIERHAVVEQVPFALTEAIAESEADLVLFREERIHRGDTFGSVMTRLGVDDQEASDRIRSEVSLKGLSQLRPGRTVRAATTIDGTLISLQYLTGEGIELSVQRLPDGSLEFKHGLVATHVELGMNAGKIRHSLFQATDDAGLDDEVAIQLAEIFSGEIDFHRDLQPGDRFSVVYEKLHAKGEYLRTGRVVAAEFKNGPRTFRAFLYRDATGREGYFTEKGRNLKKSFLRSPLEFSRITSGFSNARFHPVLESWRAHRGVDYGAPSGTRVRTTADGRVQLAGQMRGYGNVVIVQHPNGYQTLYGHLSGFGSAIRTGARVQQGDIIGFVGMTGLATGPHLHYELRVNGVHQNPLTVLAPPAEGIPAQHMGKFSNSTAEMMSRLALMSGLDVAVRQ